ncbi:MAG: hypothetical protein FJ206_13410 [Gemmatimonadetes bacterium]|nr:hypothetical protein [Gemmatimonadota bacterium]
MRVVPMVVLAVFGFKPAFSQAVRLTPEIGIYVPTERLYALASGQTASTGFEIEAGPSFGARLAVGLGSRFAIEIGGGYVPTTFSFGGGSALTQRDVKLFLGTGQGVLYLLPPTGLLSLFASGGVAVVSRGGLAFTNEAKNTSIGGVVGLGAGLRLGPLGVTIGADLLGYRADYQGSQAVSQESTQRDVRLKLGFGIPFGGTGSGR